MGVGWPIFRKPNRRCLMSMIANVLVAIVAGLHVLISLIEMLLWNKAVVHERLAFTGSEARKVAPIVANAGLYNAFIAAGLLFSLLSGDNTSLKIFFLACVMIAGIFGAVTLKWTTLVLQTIPAMAALLMVLLTRTPR